MIIRTTQHKLDNIEKENLEAHVELCAQRYSTLENRLKIVENKIDTLATGAEQSRELIIKAIGIATAVLSFIASLTVVILDKLH